jgi:hypothetical protein
VQTHDQGVQCRIVQPQSTQQQTAARPEAEVMGIQRVTGPPLPPGRWPAYMPQVIPQIPIYAFGRGRGAMLITERYNVQMREHFLQYYEHLALQQQMFQQNQLTTQQYDQFQDAMNELVELPELISIGDVDESLEDIDED